MLADNFIIELPKEIILMVYVTFWPIVLGFILAGIIQEFLPRSIMVHSLGKANLKSTFKALGFGAASSSCSYAATGITKSLIKTGADFTVAIIFMFASTNLVIEIFLMMISLMGYKFALAEVIGAILMGLILFVTAPLFIKEKFKKNIHDSLTQESEKRSHEQPKASGLPNRLLTAFGFGISELNMIKKELAAGYVLGGAIATVVPHGFWNALFLKGFGIPGEIIDAFLGPIVAMISFLCSEANILVAWALWQNNVAFAGVIAFIYGDLLIIPLLAIYKRYFGLNVTLRMTLWFWLTMSLAALATQALFNLFHFVPIAPKQVLTVGQSVNILNSTLDLLALIVLAVLSLLYLRFRAELKDIAIDPICKMQVRKSSPGASTVIDGVSYYFCSQHCKLKFSQEK